MREEYDLSDGERGKFFGKVDIENPIIDDDEALDEVFHDELLALESNLDRIRRLQPRLPELSAPTREKIAKRISNASEVLDEIALDR